MTPSPVHSEGPVRVGPHVSYRQFDDELLIVDLEGGEYFSLDRVGARMWDELVAGKTPAEVGVIMSGSFAVSADRAAADCSALVDELIERGLLVRNTT